jgi:hypothetical protein
MQQAEYGYAKLREAVSYAPSHASKYYDQKDKESLDEQMQGNDGVWDLDQPTFEQD